MTVQGLGSYSATPQARTDRRPAVVVKYHASRAHIRFHDGTTYTMPADPLIRLGVPEKGTFFVVTAWVGKEPVDSRIELPAPSRPAGEKRDTPKIVVRDGRKLITRR